MCIAKSRKPFFRLAAVVCSTALAAACARSSSTDIVVKGSSAFLPIGEKAVELYQKGHKANVLLLAGGDAVGIRALLAGTCDIASSLRPMRSDEVQEARRSGIELRQFVVGYETVVPVVAPGNPLASLGLAQLRGIFNGSIRRWTEVGGPDLPIEVVSREPGSDVQEVWNEAVMQGSEVWRGAAVAGSASAVREALRRRPAAISFVIAGQVPAELRALRVGGVPANPDTVRAKAYPISRTLYVYLDGTKATNTIQGFVDLLLEPTGQSLVEKTGYLPV